MKLFFKQKNNKNKGVTLLEALVAISIFSLSIVAMVSVVANGISSTGYAKTKTVATFLAQEGIEYMQSLRGTYVLYDGTSAQNGWNSFVARLSGASCQTGCYFDPAPIVYTNHSKPIINMTILGCSGTCPTLLFDASSGKYGYSSGLDYGFRRKITMTQISANEIKITSTVTWRQGSGNYNMVFSESLYNWIE